MAVVWLSYVLYAKNFRSLSGGQVLAIAASPSAGNYYECIGYNTPICESLLPGSAGLARLPAYTW